MTYVKSLILYIVMNVVIVKVKKGIKVANYLFVNVYMPCQGTADRITMYDDIFRDIWAWCEQHDNCCIFFAGYFNVNLDNGCDNCSTCINDFLLRYSLTRCDDTFPQTKVATYVNISLNHNSQIDYAASSSPEDIVNFEVLDPDINFSDHLPLMATVTVNCSLDNGRHLLPDNNNSTAIQHQLRWDYADRASY